MVWGYEDFVSHRFVHLSKSSYASTSVSTSPWHGRNNDLLSATSRISGIAA
jgi:hypothetical protein